MIPVIQQMLPKMDSILVSLNKLLADPALTETLHNAQRITDNLTVTTSQINNLMGNDIPRLTDKLNHISDNFVTISDNLAQTQAEFGDYEELDRDLTAKSDELKSKQQALEKLQKRAQELRDLQKELGNYQTLLDLQKQVKDTQFDSENYQKAQDIMAQGRNLQKTMKSLKEQLADLDDNNQADLSASKKLVQQKPQLLQWQAEYKSCLQKADELKQEKEIQQCFHRQCRWSIFDTHH